LAALVYDLSPRGIGLVLDRELGVGTLLEVEVDRAADVRLLFLALVRHVTPRDDGTWLVGCEFSRRLKPKQVEDLLG
jgi:hypothetical protein